MDQIEELRATVGKLSNIDERRAGLIEYRDRQLLAIADARTLTWLQMQELTGLSTRGLKLALDRARARAGG